MDRKIFINALQDSENKEISKEDILRVGAEHGIDLPKRMARYKVIDILAEECYEGLERAFAEFLTVPSWDVADYYNLTSEKINKLNDIGVIKEIPKLKEFYSRSDKQYFTARMYPLTVFNYDKADIRKAWEDGFGGNFHRLRIETKTKEELEPILNELEKVFEIKSSPETYEHRNDNGYYSYFTIKTINNTDVRKDALRLEIDSLKQEIKNINKKNEIDRKKDLDEIARMLGLEKFGGIHDFIDLKRKLDDVQKENEQLRKKSQFSNSGRKAKFSDDEKNTIYMKHLAGESIRSIANDCECSVGLVHKIINEKKDK